MFIQLATAALHVFWCWLFVDVLDIGGGIPGAGLAIICTEVLNCFFCVIIIVFSEYKNIVFENYKFSFSWKRHKKVFLSFLRNSLPIIAHIYADYFVFFLLNFIAVSFGSGIFGGYPSLAQRSAGSLEHLKLLLQVPHLLISGPHDLHRQRNGCAQH